jgi:hypothetical protein
MHHSACDATGMALFFKLWGDNCRVLSLQSQGKPIALPSMSSDNWDRTVLHRLWTKEAKEYSATNTEPSIFPLIGLDRGSGDKDPFPLGRERLPLRDKSMSTRVFYMSPTSFKKLVKNITNSGAAEFSGSYLISVIEYSDTFW